MLFSEYVVTNLNKYLSRKLECANIFTYVKLTLLHVYRSHDCQDTFIIITVFNKTKKRKPKICYYNC